MSLESLLKYFTYKSLLKNVCHASLSWFYCTTHYWQYFVYININAKCKWNGNYLFNSASLSRVGDNSLAHKLRVMTAVKLHLNATLYPTSCAIALKAVYEKGNR